MVNIFYEIKTNHTIVNKILETNIFLAILCKIKRKEKSKTVPRGKYYKVLQ